jgi:cytochrome c-type biogenesis protein CcmE
MRDECRGMRDGGRQAGRWSLGVVTALAVIALAGCDYFGFTPIKDIVATPAQFEGKEVKIKGKAADPVQVLSMRTFTVKDEGGEITVSTNGTLPAAGSDVAVKGKIKSALIVGGKAVGMHVEETQRLR